MGIPFQGGLTVLWASDGSTHALQAAHVVRRLLLPACRELRVLTVAPLGHSPAKRVTHLSEQQRETDMAAAESAARASLEALGPLAVPAQTLVRWGAAGHEIARAADDAHIDVVVMSAGAHGAIHRAMLGDASEDVLRATRRSVLLARGGEPAGEGPVVLLFDSPKWFVTAVDLVAGLRLPRSVPIWLVSFVEPARPFGGMLLGFSEHVRQQRVVVHDARYKLIEQYLDHTAEQLADAGHTEVHTTIEDGEVVEGLGAMVRRLRAALVVVGDSSLGAQAEADRSSAISVATNMSCSVLVAR